MKQNLLRFFGAGLLTLCAVPLSAYDFEVDGLYYDVISFTDLTCKVVNNGETNSYSGTITIPDVVKYNNRELKVTEIGADAFAYCYTLDNVVIGDNVTTIGRSAFNYSSVEEIKFGENLETVGSEAFYSCSNLTTVNVNKNLKSIEDFAFRETPKLIGLTIPEGMESIGSYAFMDSGIKSISIPSSVTSIGERCFENATNLSDVDFNGSMEVIPSQCFIGTSNLVSITIPPSVLTIEESSFDGSGITELNGGDNVRTIGYKAFANTKLITVNLGPSLKELDYSTFSGSTDIRTVNCYMPVAPEFTGYAQELFDGKTYIDGVLNVLVGAEAQYETTEYWKNFWNIQPSIENTLDIFSFNVYASVTGGNGKVLINGEDENRIAVKGNSPAIFTFVPDFGCKLTALTLNGEDCLDKVSGSSFTVDEIKETTYLRATYTSTPVQLTIASGLEGMVALSLPYGSSIDCVIKAKDGWEVSAVTFNGGDVTPQVSADGTYTTPILSMDGTLAISYRSTGLTNVEEAVSSASIRVLPHGDSIIVTGADDRDLVKVFDTEGKELKSTFEKEISLSSGIYIVTVEGCTFKVAL